MSFILIMCHDVLWSYPLKLSSLTLLLPQMLLISSVALGLMYSVIVVIHVGFFNMLVVLFYFG